MILVLVETETGNGTDPGDLAEASRAALTVGRGLAGQLGEALHAVAFDPARPGEVGAYGATELHRVAAEPPYSPKPAYSPELWGQALAELACRLAASAVLAAGTDRGNEVLAQAAARASRPFAAGVTAAHPPGQARGWTLTRVRAGGMLLEDAEIDGPAAEHAGTEGLGPFLGLALGAVEAVPAPAPVEAVTRTFVPTQTEAVRHTAVVDRAHRGGGRSLTTAPVVVSGGRGVGSAEGFAALEELAELLGGVVGCSRVATNNGWRPHSDQVGQTGTKIAPELYLACGISGATQHWVGCMGAKAILAINTDPEAPLVARADYAVIGDLHEVLLAILQRLREHSGRAAPASATPASAA